MSAQLHEKVHPPSYEEAISSGPPDTGRNRMFTKWLDADEYYTLFDGTTIVAQTGPHSGLWSILKCQVMISKGLFMNKYMRGKWVRQQQDQHQKSRKQKQQEQKQKQQEARRRRQLHDNRREDQGIIGALAAIINEEERIIEELAAIRRVRAKVVLVIEAIDAMKAPTPASCDKFTLSTSARRHSMILLHERSRPDWEGWQATRKSRYQKVLLLDDQYRQKLTEFTAVNDQYVQKLQECTALNCLQRQKVEEYTALNDLHRQKLKEYTAIGSNDAKYAFENDFSSSGGLTGNANNSGQVTPAGMENEWNPDDFFSFNDPVA